MAALPSVATPDRSGESTDRVTTAEAETIAAPVPLRAVAGPAPEAAVSDPVDVLKRIWGRAIRGPEI
jgi:hypothetical protein